MASSSHPIINFGQTYYLQNVLTGAYLYATKEDDNAGGQKLAQQDKQQEECKVELIEVNDPTRGNVVRLNFKQLNKDLNVNLQSGNGVHAWGHFNAAGSSKWLIDYSGLAKNAPCLASNLIHNVGTRCDNFFALTTLSLFLAARAT